MKKYFLFLSLFLATTKVFAQDFPYGNVDNDALAMTKYAKDTSAHAVYINEHGKSRIARYDDYGIRLYYEYHAKIKFFDTKEFENKGTIEIPIYSSDGTVYEEAKNIKGITYYIDDNGLTQAAELDPKKIVTVKDSKHWSTVKFAMPALRKGCVIEYSYETISPYLYLFQSWHFQDNIPKINSEYEVHIPGLWTYNVVLNGFLKLTKNKAEVEKDCFSFGSAKVDCSNIVYGINDVPAFVEEDYMTSPKNYKSAIRFELKEEVNLNTGSKTQYTKTWKDIDYELKTNEYIGKELKRSSFLKERIAPIIANKTDSLAKANAIYEFIKKNFKWNNNYGYSSIDGIKKALDTHSGSAGDINLTLVAALNAGGIPTEAVLLSTRENGFINKLYPNIGSFNYVVAKANIGGKSYLLDATDPLLPFGILPIRCLNDQGRAFSLDKPSYWIDMNTQQRESVTYVFDLTLQNDGKLTGTYTRFSGGYSAYLRRQKIKKFNSLDEYVEKFGEELNKTKITKYEIANLDTLEKPLGETYTIEIKEYDDMKNHGRFSFNPYLFNHITTNPFKLNERDFPVDWGMPSMDRCVLTVHLPSQFVLENPPQTVAYGLPNNGGRFFTNFEQGDNQFTFSYGLQFNKSIYSPEEYGYLKELYNKIILTEKNELIFKRK